jgi:octaprenyl-diphosphate synthase
LRRGRPTSNAVFGNAASVLVGDFIYTRAFQMMVTSDSLRVLKIMADSTNVISEGEVLQLLNIGRSDLTEEEYFQVIESKTAKLFEASARTAAIVSSATSEQEEALAQYAICLGTAFQIVDDILDYESSAEEMGKNVGDDLLEGKVTLPLICVLANGSHAEQELVKIAIDNPKHADINTIVNLVKSGTALHYCREMAHDYVIKAKQQLTIFPDNQYREALQQLVDLSVERIS